MTEQRQARGNTLIMVLAIVGFVLLAIAFFAINYHQTIGTQIEAQTAIDAAALQAAKDIGRIVINGNFGKVALVDDVPPDGNYALRNVLGINTILATIRLDLIIAHKLGNTTMIYAGQQLLANAAADSDTLTSTINGAVAGTATAYDKGGNTIDVLGDALAAYNNNGRRIANTNKSLVSKSMKVIVGQLPSGIGRTNVPTPIPATDDTTTQDTTYASNGFYKPYVAISVPGSSSTTVTFVASGAAPSLVSNSSFTTLTAGVAPAVVQVTADELVSSLAPNGQKGQMQSTVHVAATAQCGGQRFTTPSGGLYIAYPDGFPPSTSVDLTSVASFMNDSQLPDGSSASTASPFTGWSGQSDATYSVNSGGGNLTSAAFLGRQGDDPSVALSIMTFNWLFSLGLRPNIDAVVNALNTPLQTFGNSGKSGDTKTISADFDLTRMLASHSAHSFTTTSIPYLETKDPITGIDRRHIADNHRPDDNVRLLDGVMHELDPIGFLTTAPILRLNSNGQIESDAPIRIKEQIIHDNNLAGAAHASAVAVISAHAQKVNDLLHRLLLEADSSFNFKKASLAELRHEIDTAGSKSEELAEVRDQFDKELLILDRAQIVCRNSVKIAGITEWALNNYTRLSGPDCRVILPEKVSSLTGLMLQHLTKAPTTHDIICGGAMPTGQDSGSDWITVPFQYVAGRTADIIANHRPDNSALMPPAMAQSAIPTPQRYQFYFTLNGDAQTPDTTGSGTVLLSLAPFGTNNPPGPLNGQVVYQNTDAIDLPQEHFYVLLFGGGVTDQPNFVHLQWQAIGWNNDGNFSTSTAYYNAASKLSTVGAPSAVTPVVEFWLRCPVAHCTGPVYKIAHVTPGWYSWGTTPTGNDHIFNLTGWDDHSPTGANAWAAQHTVSQEVADAMNAQLQEVLSGGCQIVPGFST